MAILHYEPRMVLHTSRPTRYHPIPDTQILSNPIPSHPTFYSTTVLHPSEMTFFPLPNLKISILQVKVSRVAKDVGVPWCCAAGGVGETLKSIHDKDDVDKDKNNGDENNNNITTMTTTLLLLMMMTMIYLPG